jgi:hypothetical protein
LRISLFGRSTQFLAISRTLSISSADISSHETAIIPLLLTTSNDEELKERFTQVTCSPDIFSASSSEESKFDLNSSISRIFHFLIAYELDTHTPSTWKSRDFSTAKLQISVRIFDVPISIDVIIFSEAIF